LAPQGWHVPGDDEWTMLTTYLGGEKVAGGKMKESGDTHWKSTNVDATNSSGFAALPGGMRQGNGKYEAVGVFGCWWSSTENNVTYSWYRYLSWSYADITRYDATKRFGFSVRILKDQ
jgi:uncharacterized protein (TIGR02145 family)